MDLGKIQVSALLGTMHHCQVRGRGTVGHVHGDSLGGGWTYQVRCSYSKAVEVLGGGKFYSVQQRSHTMAMAEHGRIIIGACGI